MIEVTDGAHDTIEEVEKTFTKNVLGANFNWFTKKDQVVSQDCSSPIEPFFGGAHERRRIEGREEGQICSDLVTNSRIDQSID